MVSSNPQWQNSSAHPWHAHLPSDEPPAPPPEPDKLPQNDPSRPDSLPPVGEPDKPIPKADASMPLYNAQRMRVYPMAKTPPVQSVQKLPDE